MKGRSELWLRTVSATALGILALLTAWTGGLALALVWALAGAVAAWECMRLLQPQGGAGAASAPPWCALITFAAALLGWAGWPLAALAGGMAGALAAGGLAGGGVRGAAHGALAFGAGAVLAMTPPAVREHAGLGLPVLLWMFAVVWTTDVGAYFTGKTFGGPRLWPRVSPGKTWSGFVGGALLGGLAGVAVLSVAGWGGTFWIALGSVAASIAGQGGDLAESALKRRAGVKDSGRIIPGHGGVLDRLDAFWAVCALAALALVLIQLGAVRP